MSKEQKTLTPERKVISATRVLLVKVADMLQRYTGGLPDADCLRMEIDDMLAAFNELDGVPSTVNSMEVRHV